MRSASLQIVAPLIASSMALFVGLQTAKKEPFRLGTYDIPHSAHRIDPNPKWVSVPWEPKADAPFLPIRKACSAAMMDMATQDPEGVWTAKAQAAFEDWMQDCQDPVKLYRASMCIGVANNLDPTFRKRKEFSKYVGYVNIGWIILRELPHSYEFARAGYIFNAGDTDFHKYGDFSFRLLERDPKDRAVVVAMVYEYMRRKPISGFENRMFKALKEAATDLRWRPWDDFAWALAHRSYGQKHKREDSYEQAISMAESAIRKTPPGWDSTWLSQWIEVTKKEMNDPQFGRPEHFRYIDDIDP